MILLVVSSWPTVLSLAMHVMNLYLRTTAILPAESRMGRVVRGLSLLFWLFGALDVLLSFALFAGQTPIVLTVFNYLGVGYGLILGILDSLSTYCFAKYVYSSRGALGHQHSVIMSEASGIIALVGVAISSLSLVAVIVYAIAQTLPKRQVITAEWMFAFSLSILHAVTLLWIAMKVKLDGLTDLRASKVNAKQTSSEGPTAGKNVPMTEHV
eukprot:TRINITY_DN26283_c0_g1_i1.p1 TRINITY_DN26283_c0_g1~~TRINITY_DN26283_c0_g1_i1.p1  ORF type:complete len:212 (-),score=38.70 TRINITY_DN26283_c0_g1_i1:74-709(-)